MDTFFRLSILSGDDWRPERPTTGRDKSGPYRKGLLPTRPSQGAIMHMNTIIWVSLAVQLADESAVGAINRPLLSIAGFMCSSALSGPCGKGYSPARPTTGRDKSGPYRVIQHAHHTCTVLSLLAEAMRVPSGDHATAYTQPACPR